MPIPHPRLAVRVGRIPTEREVLKLAEQVSYVFGLSEAAGLKEQLRRDAEVYRDWLQSQQLMKVDAYQASLGKDEQGRQRVAYRPEGQRSHPDPESLTFLFALIFTCPQILSKPAGFDWVLQDLEAVLVARRLDPETDQVFEKAMNKARTRSRVGPPKDKALEFFRYATINGLMNPSVIIPGITAKVGKTKAVEYVAEIEHRHIGGDAGVSAIWKSYKRADRFFRQLRTRVQDKPLQSPLSTIRSDSESQERSKKTKKRMTPATHRKAPRRI